MIEDKRSASGVVERRFCRNCNREVPRHEPVRDQLIVVEGARVVEIKSELRHKKCGGAMTALMLLR